MGAYDSYTGVYDKSGQTEFSLRLIPHLEKLERYLVPDSSMLDLACGTGTVAPAFAGKGWAVCGVDISSAMLSEARRKAAHLGQDPVLSQQSMRHFTIPQPVALVAHSARAVPGVSPRVCHSAARGRVHL